MTQIDRQANIVVFKVIVLLQMMKFVFSKVSFLNISNYIVFTFIMQDRGGFTRLIIKTFLVLYISDMSATPPPHFEKSSATPDMTYLHTSEL